MLATGPDPTLLAALAMLISAIGITTRCFALTLCLLVLALTRDVAHRKDVLTYAAILQGRASDERYATVADPPASSPLGTSTLHTN
ncbi:hypothetical protein ACEZDB_25445 [Streptacidiphilus sp. N1-3]|uniref:Uncharacterized protein n=1 Tax=Streptacidiphilus alkalitolerans TaxID=3342712 RepID=A0ABV6X6T9_9ACTN